MTKKLKNFSFTHKSGILMPISSLPSPYGIGSFGKAAYDFVDFLTETKTKCWQVLPLNPTSYGDSPYQSPASSAGNPYFIDLEILMKKGLITKDELIKRVADKDFLITPLSTQVDSDVIDNAPNLKLIANYGAGFNNIDIDYAKSKGIPVTNTPKVSTTLAIIASTLALQVTSVFTYRSLPLPSSKVGALSLMSQTVTFAPQAKSSVAHA